MRYVAEMDPAHYFKWCVWDKELGGPVEGGFNEESQAWFRALQLNRGPKPRYEVQKTFGYGMDESTYWAVVDYWHHDGFGDIRDAHEVSPRLNYRDSSREKAVKECARLNGLVQPVKGLKVRGAALVELSPEAFWGVPDEMTQKEAVRRLAKWIKSHTFDPARVKDCREKVKKAFPALYTRVMETYIDLGALL